MNKKWRVILDILIGIAGVGLIVSVVITVISFGHEERIKEENIKTALSIFTFELEQKAYGEILSHNHEDRTMELTHPEKLECIYRTADYMHTAFMEKIYIAAEETEKETQYRKKREQIKAALGEYAYVADEVDQILDGAVR